LKRVVVGLLVVGLVFVGGVAFAAETIAYVKPDQITEVQLQNSVEGAAEVKVADISSSPNANKVTAEHKTQLASVFMGTVSVASVQFTFSSTQPVIIKWRDNQLLLNKDGKFYFNNGTSAVGAASAMEEGKFEARATVDLEFTASSPYNHAADASKGEIISAQGTTRDGSGSGGSGGCSTLTLSALVLFLLPAFAMARRRKK